MLQHIRDHSGKWFVKVIFGLIVVSFMIFGIGDMIRGIINHRPVAKVGDHSVSIEEFAQEVQKESSRIQAMTKGKITQDQLKQLGFYQKLLEKMIERSLIAQEFTRLKLTASNALIKNNVKAMKQFQHNGQFDYSRYEDLLKQAGISERMLVQDMRQQYINQQYFGTLTAAQYLPKFYRDTLLQAMEQKRTFAIVSIPTSKVAAPATPTEEDLQKFYDDNKEAFKKPETRQVSVMEIDINALAADQEVSEDELRQEYERRLSEFTKSEKRYVKVAAFPTEDTANAALSDLRKGKTLEAAAKEQKGSEYKDVGLVERSQLAENVRETVFNVDTGKDSGVVSSNFGYQIYQVTQVQPEKKQSFNDVRGRLEKDVKRQKYANDYEILKNKIDDELAGGAKLSDVAKQHNLKITNFEKLEQTGTAIGQSHKFVDFKQLVIDQAFSVKEQEASPVTDAKDGLAVVVFVDKVTLENIPELQEIRQEVLSRASEEARLKKAAEIAKSIATNSNNIGELAQNASKNEMPLKTNFVVSRSSMEEDVFVKESMAIELFNRAFILGVGKAGYGRTKDGFMVVMLEHVQPFTAEAVDKKKREDFNKNITAIAQRDIAEALVQSFKTHHAVKINDDHMNYFLKTIGS